MKQPAKVTQYSDGRWGFNEYWTTGKRIQVRRRTKAEAEKARTDLLVLIENGRRDLIHIGAAELAAFRVYTEDQTKSRQLHEAIAEFLKQKKRTSTTNYKAIKYALEPLLVKFGAKTAMGGITTPMLQRLLDSLKVGERRKYNLLAAWKALWAYEKRQGYIRGEYTAPENVEPIQRLPGKVNVLTPEQLRALFTHVRESYLPWLAIGAFAGVRSEEIAPDRDSKKSPLLWEDFKWDAGHIYLRRETAKTGRNKNPQPRIIPINDALSSWLAPYRLATGRVCEFQPTQGETARLGKFIGGKWPHNCLRDSFISYSVALTKDRKAVAYAAGNSEAMIAQSYEELKPEALAKEYFNDIRPTQPENVIKPSHSKVTVFRAINVSRTPKQRSG